MRSHAGSLDYNYVLDWNLVPRVSFDSENEVALTVGPFSLTVIRKVAFIRSTVAMPGGTSAKNG